MLTQEYAIADFQRAGLRNNSRSGGADRRMGPNSKRECRLLSLPARQVYTRAAHVQFIDDAQITLLPQPAEMLSSSAAYAALKATHGAEWEMGLLAHVLPAVRHVPHRRALLTPTGRAKQRLIPRPTPPSTFPSAKSSGDAPSPTSPLRLGETAQSCRTTRGGARTRQSACRTR
jgi:hypothetical protein